MSFTGPPSFTEPLAPSFEISQISSFTEVPQISSFTRPQSMSDLHPRIEQKIPGDLKRIPLNDIIQATNDFAEENIIEKNYGWKVYKGELSGKKLAFVLVEERHFINIHRVVTLSSLPEHQNIVSFTGCCDEYHQMIFVLEHPTRRGLDKHVTGAHLTWLMRVNICLDIASGLNYLQNHLPTHEMNIEDLNSTSILLDENWQAKIQLIAPSAYIKPLSFYIANGMQSEIYIANQMDDVDISRVHKAPLSFIDPLYIQTGMQSEIYSFGVILIELLCGRLAVTEDEDGRFLINLASKHYKNGTLTELVDPVLRQEMNRDSFTVFSEIAYACLDENQDKRPTISQVVEELQKVLRLQQPFEISELQQVSY
ncbi:kinase-like domain-containing protein [Tanacetum coccineum]